jgi:hypothetical protein
VRNRNAQVSSSMKKEREQEREGENAPISKTNIYKNEEHEESGEWRVESA